MNKNKQNKQNKKNVDQSNLFFKRTICIVILIISVMFANVSTYYSFINWYQDGDLIWPLVVQLISIGVALCSWFCLLINRIGDKVR